MKTKIEIMSKTELEQKFRKLKANRNCTNCLECIGCVRCEDCYMCYDLENCKYHVLNVELTEDEYKNFMKNLEK